MIQVPPRVEVPIEGGVDISVSGHATVEMDSTPAMGEQNPPSDMSVVKSLFQHNLAAIKLIRFISWQRSGTTSVVYMLTSY